MLKALTPNIMVDDVRKTIDFYVSKLGFEIIMSTDKNNDLKMGQPEDKNNLIWVMLKRDNTEIFFQKRESLSEELPELKKLPLGGAFTLYFSVDDVKSLYAKLKDEVKIVNDLHKTFYGIEEFVVKDTNGLILYFGQAQNG